MTSVDRTPTEPETSKRLLILSWVTAASSLLSVITVVILALTGQTEAAAVAAVASSVAAGANVTVNIRR
ncbi:hypothetical protein ACFV0C_08160 [Streptomyces sp. NPDC059568]|uniref:hypothetical protein n=1 Tax=Streptomyces sp. NPDC059568 TaxID=3346868 RepID=UPI0036765F0D